MATAVDSAYNSIPDGSSARQDPRRRERRSEDTLGTYSAFGGDPDGPVPALSAGGVSPQGVPEAWGTPGMRGLEAEALSRRSVPLAMHRRARGPLASVGDGDGYGSGSGSGTGRPVAPLGGLVLSSHGPAHGSDGHSALHGYFAMGNLLEMWDERDVVRAVEQPEGSEPGLFRAGSPGVSDHDASRPVLRRGEVYSQANALGGTPRARLRDASAAWVAARDSDGSEAVHGMGMGMGMGGHEGLVRLTRGEEEILNVADSWGPASPSAPQRLFWRPMYGVACPADLVRPSWSIASVKVVRSLGSNEELGSMVRKVRDRATGMLMAMKSYDKETVERQGTRRQVLREVALHSSIDHPHVVRFYVAFEDDTHFHLCTEYLGEKDLAAALSDAGGRMREREVAHLEAAPLVKLLSLLHVRGIIHRDIKPANVMMAGADGTRATLIDFGAAINAERERPRTVGGTVGHMAPEIAAPVDKFRDSYGPEVDIYSLGVLVYLLLTGSLPPWPGAPDTATEGSGTTDGVPPHTPRQDRTPRASLSLPGVSPHVARELASHGVSDLAAEWLSQCLAESPSSRATPLQLAWHPWLRPLCEAHVQACLHVVALRGSHSSFAMSQDSWRSQAKDAVTGHSSHAPHAFASVAGAGAEAGVRGSS